MEQTPLSSFSIEDADRCVMCGLCLPRCPTYRLYGQESESPRGRIALMRALATNELPMTSRLEEHLDNCLVCRACEAACPAEVPYGELIDAARASMERGDQRNTCPEPDTLLEELARLERWRPLLRFYQRSGLRKAARALGLPKALGMESLERLLPELPPRSQWREHYAASGEERGEVALFVGCTGKALDDTTLQAAIEVLNRIGYSVRIPRGQTCCGALHRHRGRMQKARELAQANLDSFQPEEVDAIVHVTSGCGVQLMEYPLLAGLDPERAQRFSEKVFEISQFIHDTPWPEGSEPAPLDGIAALHLPCSLQHPRYRPETITALLERIPRLRVIPLPDNALCCGAAGDYALRHPAAAKRLLAPKLESLKRIGAELLVTANIGCALHFKAALREQGESIEVLHPIELLARRLRHGDRLALTPASP